MKLTVLFENFGPYHIARLAALGPRCSLLAVEQHANSVAYDWCPSVQVPFRRVTLFERVGVPREAASEQTHRAISEVLSGFGPDVVAVPGWADEQAISAVAWALRHRVPVIVMSESQAIDFPRTKIREWVKRCYLVCCDGALVGGRPQSDYLVELGMNAARIRVGYDVVDNEYFYLGASRTRANATALRQQHGLPERYFLTSARFIEKKNLPRLIQAFADFLSAIDEQPQESSLWHLVVLGDGPLRGELEQRVAALELGSRVLMPGFKQYPELPLYYGLAQAFILPSTTEQWGLVVNEAMASGLPVLVSERCGCARDLVQSGVNGYTFGPRDVSTLAGLMLRLAENEDRRQAMGEASANLIKAWSPDMFAANLIELAEMAKNSPRISRDCVDRLLLRMMLNLRRWTTR
jgi:glycosyltransferase involved in cell wall biosynthesis